MRVDTVDEKQQRRLSRRSLALGLGVVGAAVLRTWESRRGEGAVTASGSGLGAGQG